jgi:hypothetical protein
VYGIALAQLVDYIAENRNNSHDFIDVIMKLELRDIEQLKNHCSVLVFLITKNYLQSEVFKKDLKEARKLNREIYIILLEELEFGNNLLHEFEILDFKNFKKFDFSEFLERERNFRKLIGKSFSIGVSYN